MAGEHDAGEPAPRLWSPAGAIGWSMLFGPLFGVVLHWKNWQALGQPRHVADARRWLCMTLLGVLSLAALAAADVPPSVGRGLDWAVLVGWYVRSGRVQCRHVADTYGDDYPYRSLALPVALASACGLALMGLLIMFSYIAPQGPELA